MRYSPSEKISIIIEVLKNKQSVYAVCKKHNVSKTIFYKWLARYKRIKKNRLVGLESKVRKGISHPRSLSYVQKIQILGFVHKHPEHSCRQVAKTLNIGHHAIQNLLEKEYLGRFEQRQNFAKQPFWKRESADRRLGMMELHKQGWKVNDICRHYKVSKPTFAKWRKRFEQADEQQKEDVLRDSYVQGSDHHRWLGDGIRSLVIDAVRVNPQYSAHKLHVHLNNEEALRLRSGSTIGHHAIQNVLVRENLNTLEKRQVFAAGYMPEPKVQVASLYEVPVPKLSVLRMLIAPFTTVPKWIIKHPISWPIVLPSIIFLAYIFEVDKAFKPTVFFPLVALTFGFFFFLYSMKYYISLIIVMRVSQKGAGAGEQKKQGRIVSFLEKYFKLGSARISRVDPLLLNLEKVELSRQPFVSIHLAIYNEKRVVGRLIEACQNQEWGNYEVILADDSTDETTEIAKEILSRDGRILNRNFVDEALEIFVSTPPIGSSLPVIKLIHRFSRDGYKGAALQKALENTDARAEYISVFDSDFVPYPDTIAQFVKSFQESCGGLDRVKDSNLAAVQGYQWHVLNKSQNWVTRGVRTEYAGSYVIERAGIGIYGGLNMIAGSVFCIRADLLRAFAWGRSITEDFELTLRLYERGYKVLFTPYIQAPAEAVSTVRRLIRQRMRWAEGHTFNIRKMALRILESPYVSRREKSEFIYLAPYYLQAAFFIVGTLAWFLSEAVLHVRLPFWTAAWGWSLVFVNFLALPLMNLVGLFLEESEERDYLGIASFMILSYIVVPFQAYAAVKALFEDSEGPWFRTPKTGNITDAFDRVNFYKFIDKFKSWGRGGSVSAPVFSPAFTSAYNRFGGYNIKVKRSAFVSRGVLAGLLILVMFVNYLAFFAPVAKADATTPALEQQINIMNGTYSNAGQTSYVPTNESLGIILWDADVYDGTVTVYFEAVIKTNNASYTTTAGLFDTTDNTNPVSSGTVTSTNTSYERQRTGALTLTDNHEYTVEIKTSNASGTPSIQAARLIITQTASVKITKTETQIEVGIYYAAIANTDYNRPENDMKYYCYDSTGTGTTCSAASPSRYSPAPTMYFEATLANSAAGNTTSARLQDCSAGPSCSTGGASGVTGSDVNAVGTSFTRVRSGAITLVAGKQYTAHYKVTAGTGTVSNAKIILTQSDATNGVSAVETTQLYATQDHSTISGYASLGYPNSFTSTNYSGTQTYYFDTVVYYTNSKGSGTPSGRISDGSQNLGEVTWLSASGNRMRSTSFTPTTAVFDQQLGCVTCSNRAAFTTVGYLIIQSQSMPVPEVALLALPGSLFLPKIARWWKNRQERRRKNKIKAKPI